LAKTWIARCARALRKYGASGLMLICVGIVSGPASADKAQTDSAIASYLNTTLPAIERMKPFIGQPEAARATAFAGMGLPDTECDAAAVAAIYAREKLAEGAANVCRGLMAWMQGDEISACGQVKYSESDLAKTDQANPAILNRHIETDVLGTRLQLERAAGCAQKDIAYWGSAVIRIHDELSRSVSLAGDMVASASDKAPLTAKQFEHKLYQCFLARNLDDTRKSAVVEAANDGCYAMSNLARKKMQGACESIEEGLKLIDAIGAGDPFAPEAPAVRTLLIDSFSDLTCGPILTAAHAEARAAAARAQQAEEAKAAQAAYDAAWTGYNNLQRQLDRDFDELKDWDDEYGLSSDGGDASFEQVADGYCQIYNGINQTQFDIVNAAEAIYRLQPDTTNLSRLREEQKLKEQLNIKRNGWCEAKLE
jgi:hypothetical protein